MTLVSVIVPCYNEQDTICMLLEALRVQTFPIDKVEAIIADGMSTDHTLERIKKYQNDHPELSITVVGNPKRIIPAGLNCALEAAKGDIIVRLDAHSVPRPDYISQSVEALNAGLGDNVGGVWEIAPRGKNWQARSIAVAAAHPLGVGDAHYRYSERAQEVDTVPFGSFYHTLIEKIGLFDESLLANEDYEFNVRLRQKGGKVWLDPAIRSIYFARANLVDLARQYWRYGFWKARMLRRYPDTIRWRQALPPAFVISLLLLGVLSIWFPIAAWIFVIELASYVLIMLFIGIGSGLKNQDPAQIIGVPLAIATMHLFWGSAFLWSMVR